MKFFRCFTTCVIALSGAAPTFASAETPALRIVDKETTAAAQPTPSQQDAGTLAVPPLTLPMEQNSAAQTATQAAGKIQDLSSSTTATSQAELPKTTLSEITTRPLDSKSAATPSATPASSSEKEIPFSLEGVPAFNPVEALGAMALFLVAFALIGVTVVKLKKGKKQGSTRAEKPMEVVSSMAIGPKRQLMIVRIRDQEIVIASTETGVTMLTDVSNKPQRPTIADMRPLQQLTKATPDVIVSPREQKHNYDSDSEETSARKSDFLQKALNNLKEKKSSRPAISTDAYETDGEPQIDFKSESKKARSPALSGNKNGFNKFFANAFEQEASRSIGKKTAIKSQPEPEESVENVTKMIREKLKNMQPAGQS
jgi:flagellar biogenesis protein FliO